MKIILVAGARPNFMKVAPIIRAIDKRNVSSQRNLIEPVLVHTGQHYDYEMSKIFFEDLEISEPDIYLGVGSGTHAEQTGKIMIEFEKVLFKENADLVMVVGDVNSTLAAALTAVKLHIPIAHIEAGLRSYDMSMPEEVNRLLTDAISDYLFTPSGDANVNLKREQISEEKIYLVGNVMADSLLSSLEKAKRRKILSRLNLGQKRYAILTLHRPSHVDTKENLLRLLAAVEEVAEKIPIVFPIHPRTRKNMESFGLGNFFTNNECFCPTESMGYLDFLCLMMNSRFVMTDSGGIQEETTILNIPCLTLRDVTERPITLSQGTNTLVGNDPQKIIKEAFKILDGKGKKGTCPELWDGKTSERIVEILT